MKRNSIICCRMRKFLIKLHLNNFTYLGHPKMCLLVDERWQTIEELQQYLMQLNQTADAVLEFLSEDDFLIPAHESTEILRFFNNIKVQAVAADKPAENQVMTVQSQKRKFATNEVFTHSTPTAAVKRVKLAKKQRSDCKDNCHDQTSTDGATIETPHAAVENANSPTKKSLKLQKSNVGSHNTNEGIKVDKSPSFYCPLSEASNAKSRRISVSAKKSLQDKPVILSQFVISVNNNNNNTQAEKNTVQTELVHANPTANMTESADNNNNGYSELPQDEAMSKSVSVAETEEELAVDETESPSSHVISSFQSGDDVNSQTNFGENESVIDLNDSEYDESVATAAAATSVDEKYECAISTSSKLDVQQMLKQSVDLSRMPVVDETILFRMQSTDEISKYLIGKVEYANKRAKLLRIQLLDGSKIALTNDSDVSDVLSIKFNDMLHVKLFQPN